MTATFETLSTRELDETIEAVRDLEDHAHGKARDGGDMAYCIKRRTMWSTLRASLESERVYRSFYPERTRGNVTSLIALAQTLCVSARYDEDPKKYEVSRTLMSAFVLATKDASSAEDWEKLKKNRVVCAWCDAELAPGLEPISHGICASCFEREKRGEDERPR